MNEDLKWRNLFLQYDKILTRIILRNNVRSVVGCDGEVYIHSRTNIYYKILDQYYSKKGIKVTGHHSKAA